MSRRRRLVKTYHSKTMATRAADKPTSADAGMLWGPITASYLSTCNRPIYDSDGNLLTADNVGSGVKVPWQDWWSESWIMHDDSCYLDTGIENTRKTADGHTYQVYSKQREPGKGSMWSSHLWTKTFLEWPSKNNIVEISEDSGNIIVTVTDITTGTQTTYSAEMYTDTDDLENRPATECGQTVISHVTDSNTVSKEWVAAGSIEDPVYQQIKLGSTRSNAYQMPGLRTSWAQTGLTTPYSCTWKRATDYYGYRYVEDGETKLDLVPCVDMSGRAGFYDRVSHKIRYSQGSRDFQPIYDDGLAIGG